MADEIRELMNKKDEIEKEIKQNLDYLQSVGVIRIDFFKIPKSLHPHQALLLIHYLCT